MATRSPPRSTIPSMLLRSNLSCITPHLTLTYANNSRDIAKLNEAVEEIVAERKSRLRRYVSAKQHCKKLQIVAKKLEEARGNYTVSCIHHAPEQYLCILFELGGSGHAERDNNLGRPCPCTGIHTHNRYDPDTYSWNASCGYSCVPFQRRACR